VTSVLIDVFKRILLRKANRCCSSGRLLAAEPDDGAQVAQDTTARSTTTRSTPRGNLSVLPLFNAPGVATGQGALAGFTKQGDERIAGAAYWQSTEPDADQLRIPIEPRALLRYLTPSDVAQESLPEHQDALATADADS
jgi:hypothetical protein